MADKEPMDRICGVECDGPFMRIRGFNIQLMKQIQNVLKLLESKFDKANDCMVKFDALYRGKKLACKTNPDGSWYRCEVTNVEDYMRLNVVGVKMMEFGTELSIPINHLRDISLFNKSDSLFLPAQHRMYYIQGLMNSEGWIPEKVELIKSILMCKTSTIKVNKMFSICNRVFAEVSVNGMNLSEIAMKEGCGSVVTSAEQANRGEMYWAVEGVESNRDYVKHMLAPSPDLLGLTPPRVPYTTAGAYMPTFRPNENPLAAGQKMHNMQTDPPPMQFGSVTQNMFAGAQHGAQFQVPQVPQPSVVNSVKADVVSPSVLPAGVHQVNIAFIEEGPYSFYVQLKSQEQTFQDISRFLNQTNLNPPSILRAGFPCAVKTEKGFFRGIVTAIDKQCTVQLIDLGYPKSVPFADIFELPLQLYSVGQLAYKFCLSGLLDNSLLRGSDIVVETFRILTILASSLQLQVAPADGPPITQYCKLFAENKNVLESLIAEASKPIKYHIPSFGVSMNYEVVVSFVDTANGSLPWVFYVQLASEWDKIEKMSARLEEYCLKADIPEASQLKAKHPVFAQYEADIKWYRGLILNVKGSCATVFFVDFGNTEDVPLAKLRAASRTLINEMPAQAVKCVLDGCSANDKAASILEQRHEDKVYNMTVIYKVDSCDALTVRLLEKDSKGVCSLNDIIIMELIRVKAADRKQSLLVPDMTVPPPCVPNQPVVEPRNDSANKVARSETRKPDKELYTPPVERRGAPAPPLLNLPERRKPRDWDDPSQNFFADNANPPQGNGKKGSSSGDSDGRSSRKSFDEVDRSSLKRSSNSQDDWDGKSKSNKPSDWVTEKTNFKSPEKANQQEWNSKGAFEGGSHNSRNSDFSGGQNRHDRDRGRSFDRQSNAGNYTFGEKFEGKNNFGGRNDRGGGGQKFGGSQNDRRRDSSDRRGNDSGRGGGHDWNRRNDNSSNQDFLGGASQEGRQTNGDGFKGQRNSGGQKQGGFASFGQNGSAQAAQAETEEWGSSTSIASAGVQHPKILPYPVKIGQTLQCAVVYTQSPTKFYVQPTMDAAKIDEITVSATAGIQDKPEEATFSVRDSCWAKFVDDEQWYRATISEALGDNYKVFFVDYGNSSEASKADVQPVKPEHVALPAQGVCCTLRGVKETEWTDEDIVKFEGATTEKEFQVAFISKIGDKFSVVLSSDGECINKNFGATAESLLPLGKLPSEEIAANSAMEKATISWFVDPKNFSMHRTSSCENLREKIDVPVDSLPKLPLFEPKVGSLVHLEINKKLLRGQIVAVKGDKCKVELADYGRIMMTVIQNLNALPEDLAKLPKQAITCSIADVEVAEGKSWPKAGANPTYDNIFIQSRTFTVDVKKVLDDGKLEVELKREDGAQVSDLLREHEFAAKPKTAATPILEAVAPNAEWKVFATYFDHHSRFYVQKEADQQDIENLLGKLQHGESETLESVKIGDLVLARNPEDEFWYRCTVTKTEPMTGLLVDYGNTVVFTEVKPLPEEFKTLPPFATCCCIPMCALPEHEAAFEEQIEAELFKGDVLSMKIKAVANEYLIVDFKMNEDMLVDTFFQKGMAIRTMFEGFVSNILSLEAIDCQNAESTGDLDTVTEALLKAEEFPNLEEVSLGDKCVAKFADDECWYRAEITNLEDGKKEVCFYDYGNSAEVTEMKKMPEELVGIRQLSQLLKMINVSEGEVVESKLIDILSDSSTKFEFFTLSPSSIPLNVVIFKDGIDIRDIASRGLNIMAAEFKPKSCYAPPVDLATIAVGIFSTKPVNMSGDAVQIDVEMTDSSVVTMSPTKLEVENQKVLEDNVMECSEGDQPEAKIEETEEKTDSAPLEELVCESASVLEEPQDIEVKEEGLLEETEDRKPEEDLPIETGLSEMEETTAESSLEKPENIGMELVEVDEKETLKTEVDEDRKETETEAASQMNVSVDVKGEEVEADLSIGDDTMECTESEQKSECTEEDAKVEPAAETSPRKEIADEVPKLEGETIESPEPEQTLEEEKAEVEEIEQNELETKLDDKMEAVTEEAAMECAETKHENLDDHEVEDDKCPQQSECEPAADVPIQTESDVACPVEGPEEGENVEEELGKVDKIEETLPLSAAAEGETSEEAVDANSEAPKIETSEEPEQIEDQKECSVQANDSSTTDECALESQKLDEDKLVDSNEEHEKENLHVAEDKSDDVQKPEERKDDKESEGLEMPTEELSLHLSDDEEENAPTSEETYVDAVSQIEDSKVDQANEDNSEKEIAEQILEPDEQVAQKPAEDTDFVFRKPLPVDEPRDDDTSSLHGSDMSIDDACDQPAIIFSCPLQGSAPVATVDTKEDSGDHGEQVEVKKPNLVASSEAGDQVVQDEGMDDAASQAE